MSVIIDVWLYSGTTFEVDREIPCVDVLDESGERELRIFPGSSRIQSDSETIAPAMAMALHHHDWSDGILAPLSEEERRGLTPELQALLDDCQRRADEYEACKGYNPTEDDRVLFNQWLHKGFMDGKCTYDFYAKHSKEIEGLQIGGLELERGLAAAAKYRRWTDTYAERRKEDRRKVDQAWDPVTGESRRRVTARREADHWDILERRGKENDIPF